MSEKTLEDQLKNLRCHFTWNLQLEGYDIFKKETLSDQTEFPHTYNKYLMCNWKAYMEYVQGDYTEAMARLREAEELCLSNSNQSPAKLLVIYGNYAWLYYTLKEHETAQLYVENVESIYQELKQSTDPKLFNCPEIDGEQGWTLLLYSVHYYEQAKECFEKALKSAPEDPDWNTGYAITIYRLELFPDGKYPDHHSLDLLKRATELNPKDTGAKTLLGLKLQALNKEGEGLKYIAEALEQTPGHPSCLRYAAKFYRKAGMIDEALYLLTKALGLLPKSAFLHHQIGLCHRAKILAAKKSEHPDNPRQEEINEHIKKAIDYFKLTLECDKSFRGVYADLANMSKK
uniref:Uncharacterized protein n=1 Tax=Leptobrachium leishanense TaxID=445787 RepID=A0A8C5MZZ8_9ANUR